MLKFLNLYRGITIFLIVLGHCYGITGFSRGEPTFIKKMLMASITGGTMAFVFISGFLFHHVFYTRGFNLRRFMLGKWKNVFMPFIIISIPIFIFSVFIKDIPLYQAVPKFFLGRFLSSTWYIPFALLLFLSSPIFIKFIEQPHIIQRRILLITIITSLLIFRAQVPYENTKVIMFSLLHNFAYFISSYLVGIYSSINRTNFLKHVTKYNLTYLFIWLAIVLFQAYTNDYQNTSSFFFDIMYIQKLLMIFWSIGFLKSFEKKITGKLEKVITKLAEYSFGIFFIHNYFLLIFGKINSLFLKNNLELMGLILTGIIIIILSIVVAKLVKIIFGKRSRMIVGV